jgi:hypothetical protein
MVRVDSKTFASHWPLRLPYQECGECKGLQKDDRLLEEERAFELADSMENGIAKEIEAEYSTPLRRSSQLYRFHVERSNDRCHFRLYSEDGAFVMYAKVVREWKVDFLLYDPQDRDSRSDKPAFSMTGQRDAAEWTVYQERCERCQLSPWHTSCAGRGRQQVAHISHAQDEVDGDVVNSTEIRLPGRHQDGSQVLWCPLLGKGDLANAPEEEIGCEVRRLVARTPEWRCYGEEDDGDLELPFRNREVLPSAKNLMLGPASRPEQVVLQHGKIGPQTFALDFRYPMSVVQAFAVSVSTLLYV